MQSTETLLAASQLVTYRRALLVEEDYARPIQEYLAFRVPEWTEATNIRVHRVESAQIFRFRLLGLSNSVLEFNTFSADASVRVGRVESVYVVESRSIPYRCVVLRLSLLESPSQRAARCPVYRFHPTKRTLEDTLRFHKILVEGDLQNRARVHALVCDVRRRHTLVPAPRELRDKYGDNVYYDLPGLWGSK